MTDEGQDDLAALGTLGDPTRRAVYEVVVAADPEPVGRDEVAQALEVGRTLAAFHLDKLVAAGLLEVSFARRTGRAGPGAGRPAKLYRRAAREITASVPPRAYRSAAELLALAVEQAGADETLFAVARAQGSAHQVVSTRLLAELAARGYEPTRDGKDIRLRNCPFHQLAEQFAPLVCGMNLALLQGMLGTGPWQATLDPVPGQCCVRISKTSHR
jgi:predicted ArsR family transcriptional regulator